MTRPCWYCPESHALYYLQKTNGELSMFSLCPTLKGEDQIFIRFLQVVHNLPLPIYVSGSPEYEALKEDLKEVHDFSESEKITTAVNCYAAGLVRR